MMSRQNASRCSLTSRTMTFAPDKLDSIDPGTNRQVQATLTPAAKAIAGDYSIADIAIWPWISRFAWQTVDFAEHPNVKRWYLAIAERPAVKRGWDVLKEGRAIPMP